MFSGARELGKRPNHCSSLERYCADCANDSFLDGPDGRNTLHAMSLNIVRSSTMALNKTPK